MSLNEQNYTVKFVNYSECFIWSANNLFNRREFCDVTLMVDGYLIGAHRFVLSIMSPYFHKLFTEMPTNQYPCGKSHHNHNIILNHLLIFLFEILVFLKDVSIQTIQYLLTFIYRGSVNIPADDIDEFKKMVIQLQIKSLDTILKWPATDIQPQVKRRKHNSLPRDSSDNQSAVSNSSTIENGTNSANDGYESESKQSFTMEAHYSNDPKNYSKQESISSNDSTTCNEHDSASDNIIDLSKFDDDFLSGFNNEQSKDDNEGKSFDSSAQRGLY